jgi:hypothetical protein
LLIIITWEDSFEMICQARRKLFCGSAYSEAGKSNALLAFAYSDKARRPSASLAVAWSSSVMLNA